MSAPHQSHEENRPRRNYVRRGLGLVLCTAPTVLLAASLLYGIVGHDRVSVPGLVTELLALSLAVLNFYLSFLRGPIHRWRGRSLDGYRNVTGIPVIGTALAAVGAFLGFGSVLGATIGLLPS